MRATSAVATANKMNSHEEIEDAYKKDVEALDKQFLENLSATQDKEKIIELENAYKQNLNTAVTEYRTAYKTYLKNPEEEAKKETEDAQKKKYEGTFKVVPLHLEDRKKENLHTKWKLFVFRMKLATKKFIRRITPRPLIVLFLKLKVKSSNSYTEKTNYLKDTFTKRKNKTIASIKKVKDYMLKKLEAIAKKTKELSNKLNEKIIKFVEKKSNKKEKTEEDKIVEKLLKKNS